MEAHDEAGADAMTNDETAADGSDSAADAVPAHQTTTPDERVGAGVDAEEAAGGSESGQEDVEDRTEPGDAPAGSLEDDLAEARRAAQDNLDRALRAQAELENVRRRLERDLEKAHKFALDRFVSELLPVKDSMELGLAAATAENASTAGIAEGVELTLRMFEQVLEKFGVTAVDPAGEVFDPEFHQAMTMRESDAADSGTVITVVQKGYRLNERLVRPAMVVVAK